MASLFRHLALAALLITFAVPSHATESLSPDGLLEAVLEWVDSLIDAASMVEEEPSPSTPSGFGDEPPDDDEFGPVLLPGG